MCLTRQEVYNLSINEFIYGRAGTDETKTSPIRRRRRHNQEDKQSPSETELTSPAQAGSSPPRARAEHASLERCQCLFNVSGDL